MKQNFTKTGKTIRDILKVSLSNILKLLSGVLVGFLLPKIIGVTDYGYYKTFTLYAAYVGLLHFGFIDGIYLKFGGKNYEELEKESFRLYSKFLFIIEFFVVLLSSVAFLLTLNGELRFIFLCLAVYCLITNIIGYYQVISQITSRFNELSLRNIFQSILIALSVIALWIIHVFYDEPISYRVYTIVYLVVNLVLSIWYIFTYRGITFGKSAKFSVNSKQVFSFFVLGLPLLVSNLCSSLILAIDRQFVNILFEVETYAVYAFAYNMLALITTALSAISTVLYPSLKKADSKSLKNNYPYLVGGILIIVFLFLIFYFPLMWFVPWFLPNYAESLPIFRVILPGLAISSAVTIVMHNYYKTEGKELLFFAKSLVVLSLSIVANLCAYYFFKTTISISIASIIVMTIWYFLVEVYFIRRYKINWIKNSLYLVFMSSSFYLITWWNNWWASMLIYLAILILASIIFYKNELQKFFLKKNKQLSISSNDDSDSSNK